MEPTVLLSLPSSQTLPHGDSLGDFYVSELIRLGKSASVKL